MATVVSGHEGYETRPEPIAHESTGVLGNRQLRVEPVMGTTVSIDIRPPFVSPAAIDDAVAWFHDVDRRFSMYRPDSELSRVADGRLSLRDASPEVRSVVALADALRDRTDGYFDARRHRPDGRLDPTGVVKGWAVDEAVAILRLAGARNLQVGAGGDLVAAGRPSPERSWRIGIRHPQIDDRVAAVLEVSNLAVATSAAYERGAHIRDPRTGREASGLRSLTVIGPTLAIVDAFATAAYAMGEQGIAWVAAQPGYGALGITLADRVVWTPLVEELLVSPRDNSEPLLTPLSGGSG
jgi:FAD:protein FMN transferase